MSIAAAQYDQFQAQVADGERVFTFTDDGELLVYPVRSGETVPFWSSRSRLERIQHQFPKYRQWEITELALAEFWSRLDQLEREQLQVGINWSGKNLTGYNVSAAALRSALRHAVVRAGKGHLLDRAS